MINTPLIAKLSSELKPVKPLPQIPLVALLLTLFAAGVSACYFIFSSYRSDLSLASGTPVFLLGGLILTALFFLSLWSFVCDLVPGCARFKVEKYGWVAAGFVWLGFLAAHSWSGSLSLTLDDIEPSIYWDCFTTISMLAAAPVVAFLVFLQWGMPRSSHLIQLKATVASAALGALLIGFTCPADDASHLMFSHTLPVFVIAGFVWVLSVAIKVVLNTRATRLLARLGH